MNLEPAVPGLARRLALLAAATAGASAMLTQLALLRELLGAVSGNELVLGLALGLWLLLTGVGARLGATDAAPVATGRRLAAAFAKS
ncbi:MAG TPA: hypothetical protein VG936_13040 [Lacunisphaera sp.]|nr:hypothetical protein [Lacunisphaera sp.]